MGLGDGGSKVELSTKEVPNFFGVKQSRLKESHLLKTHFSLLLLLSLCVCVDGSVGGGACVRVRT